MLLYARMRVTFYIVLHRSRRFFITPITSPSLSITYRLTILLIVLTVHHRYLLSLCLSLFFVLDLFHPFYTPSIIPLFCGWMIIVQNLCILVARQLAYCLRGLMICFLSNTLLLYLDYFIYCYLCSWIYNELLPYSKTSVLNWTRYLLKFNSTASLSLLN